MVYTVEPIGVVRSPYTQKFGIPRQPHLVPSARVCLRLNRVFGADSVRGLQGFEYIWVHFVFHDALAEGWAQMVRPPRLGGKKKMGVFATRSPHRPNHLGLSLLKLETIEVANGCVEIYCSGADLLDNTPIIDIKPYLPFVEAKPHAKMGFVAGAPPQLTVHFLPDCGANDLSETVLLLIEQSLAQDPRPAYQDLPDREYVMAIAQHEVRFKIADGVVRVHAISRPSVATK